MLIESGKSSALKGDRGMKEKYSMFKLVFASLACCLLAVTMITGCGGGNNPSGPSSGTPVAAFDNFPSNATGSVTLNGLLVDLTTQSLINSTDADLYVTIEFIGTTYKKTLQTVENRAFTFFDLPEGQYLITVEDKNGVYDNSTPLIQELTGKINLTIPLSPKAGSATPSSLNFYAKVLDASLRNPIMFATVDVTIENITNLTFQATTLYDGQFSLLGISSGTYTLKIKKDGYVEVSKTLIITDRIVFGSQEISTTNITNFTDGANNPRQGYNLGEIVLAPQFVNTGGLSGILLDANKQPITDKLDLVYIRTRTIPEGPGALIPNVTPNALGYVSFKNLPAGFYMLAYANDFPIAPPAKNWVASAILDADSNISGWGFTPASLLVTRIWLEVIPGSVTPIPEQQ